MIESTEHQENGRNQEKVITENIVDEINDYLFLESRRYDAYIGGDTI